MSTTASELHVVLGAGQIGPRVAAGLRARGHRVRIVRRGRFGAEVPAGVEAVNADVLDPAALAAATAGATAIYHCANPRYTEWSKRLLPLASAIIGAAEAARAHLVVLDNLYMYGRAPGGVMREDTPLAPCSKKGALRAEADAAYRAARDRGLVVSIGRASDFIGPDATQAAIFGERFWPRLLAGRKVEVLGDPDQPHSYSSLDDVAAGLVTLGTDPRAANQVWHLPANPAISTRAVIDQIAAHVGRPATLTRLPTWLLRGVGVVAPLLREVAEMAYQWEAPFILDDGRFRATFGATATPWPDVIAATVAWAQATYAPPARAAA